MRSQQQIQTTWIRNFGGVCQYPGNTKNPLYLLADALNYYQNDRGELVARKGHVKYFDQTVPDGLEIRSTFVVEFREGKKILLATDRHVYEMFENRFEEIYELEALSKYPISFALVNEASIPVVVFGNGHIPLKKWDGAVITNCGGGAPRGIPISYKNYIAVYNIEGQPKGRIQFNALKLGISDPDLWEDPISGIFRYIDISGEITALKETFGLLVFCYNKTFLLTGDPEGWGNLSRLPSNIGCISQHLVIDCEGSIVWVDRTGIYSWDGSGAFPTNKLNFSGDLTVSNIGKDFDAIPRESLIKSAIHYSPLQKTLYFSSRNYETAYNNKTWIYDFKRSAWFPWSYGFSAFVFFEIRDVEIRIGFSFDGYPLKIAAGEERNDNGTPYYFFILFPDIDMGDAMSAKIWRAFHLGCRGLGLNRINGIYYGDFEDDPDISIVDRFKLDETRLGSRFQSLALTRKSISDTQVFSFDFNSGGFILGGTFDGGASRLDEGTLDPPKRYIIKRVPVSLRAKYLRLYIYGSEAQEAVPINEIGIEWRYVSMRKQLVKETE